MRGSPAKKKQSYGGCTMGCLSQGRAEGWAKAMNTVLGSEGTILCRAHNAVKAKG